MVEKKNPEKLSEHARLLGKSEFVITFSLPIDSKRASKGDYFLHN